MKATAHHGEITHIESRFTSSVKAMLKWVWTLLDKMSWLEVLIVALLISVLGFIIIDLFSS